MFDLNFSSSATKGAISPLPVVNRAFPRGTVNRSTFHSGQTRERRQPSAFNGPGGVPLTTQDSSAMSRQSFFSKLSSKFSKRFVNTRKIEIFLKKCLFLEQNNE